MGNNDDRIACFRCHEVSWNLSTHSATSVCQLVCDRTYLPSTIYSTTTVPEMKPESFTITGHSVILRQLVEQALEDGDAASDQEAMDDLGEVSATEGGVPVSSGFLEMEIKSEFSSQTILSNEKTTCVSAGKRSTERKNEKRNLKRKQATEERKGPERATRLRTALSSAIQSEPHLRSFGVSGDQLTAKPSMAPGDLPLTLEGVHAANYHVIEWDGR
jgi:hypothetical protein